MKTSRRWLEISLLVVPWASLVAIWPHLPDRVPIHWNLAGEVNGSAPKFPGILLLPVVALGVFVLLRILPGFDPKLRRSPRAEGRMGTVLPILRRSLLALLDALFFVQLTAALGWNFSAGRLILLAVLVCFLIMGNYFGNLRPNYFIGLRIPWTLEDPATWRATHRLGGRLMVFGSLALLVAEFALDEATFGRLFLGAMIGFAVWAFAYSWHRSRTHAAPTSI